MKDANAPLIANGNRLLKLVWATIIVAALQFAYGLWGDFQAIEQRAAMRTLSFVRLVEEHAASTIDRANLTLLSVLDGLSPQDFRDARALSADRRKQIEDRLKTLQSRAVGVVSMSITDADGYVFANSVGVAPGRNLGDRKYFLDLQARPNSRPVISEAIYGRVSNKWGVQIARRIDMPDGKFAGVIVANLGLAENFDRFYQSINLGNDNLIALVSEDAQIMARFPLVPEMLGKQLGSSVAINLIRQGIEEKLVTSKSPIDGVVRWVGVRRVNEFPVFALVGLSRDSVLESWYYDIKVTVVFVVMMLLGGGLITREVLERQQAEVSLRLANCEAEKNVVAKTKFLAAASHDLRQPLQAINLFLASLGRTPLNDKQKGLVTSLSAAVRSQGEMLNTLLDISRLDAGTVVPRVRPVPLSGVLEQLDAEFSPICLERNLRFKLVYPFSEVAALTDPELLVVMMRNMIGNAIKYTPRGGVLVSVRPRGEHVLIQIWDTGIGISSEYLGNIFEEYFQIGNTERDRSRGLGLGLSIVKRLALLLNAEVTCRSRLTRGSVFSITMPRAEIVESNVQIEIEALPERHSEPSPWVGKTVVIVEDDVLVAQALESALGDEGINALVFTSAISALEFAEIGFADFYLSDFRLPGPYDGLQLLERLQQRAGHPIQAALLTGDTSPEQIERTRLSPWPVLFKPVVLSAVLAAMSTSDIKKA